MPIDHPPYQGQGALSGIEAAPFYVRLQNLSASTPEKIRERSSAGVQLFNGSLIVVSDLLK